MNRLNLKLREDAQTFTSGRHGGGGGARRSPIGFARLMISLLAGGIILFAFHCLAPHRLNPPAPARPLTPSPLTKPSTIKSHPAALLSAGDAAYRRHNWQQAAAAYRQVIQKASTLNLQPSTLNPAEAAALARFRLAYVYAQQKQYEQAIATLQELLDHYTGPPQRDPQTLATLPERARYQIACCYRGMMREAQRQSNQSTGTSGQSTANPVSRNAAFYRQKAIEEFTRFLGQCPTSPLAHTAARAIADLNGGKLPKRAGALYAHALRLEEKQRKEEQRQQAMCGPEALRWVLAHWHVDKLEGLKVETAEPANLPTCQPANLPTPSVAELAQACGTSERGTTLFDLARVARQYGLRVSGVQATWEGLQQITPPAILLWGAHYVVLTRVDRRGVSIVDPSPSVNASKTNKRIDPLPGEREHSFIRSSFVDRESEQFLPAERFQSPWQGYLLVIHGKRLP